MPGTGLYSSKSDHSAFRKGQSLRWLRQAGTTALLGAVLSLVPLVPSIAASTRDPLILGIVRANMHSHPAGMHPLGENILITDVGHKNVVPAVWTFQFSNFSSDPPNDPVIRNLIPCPIYAFSTRGQISAVQKGVPYFFDP